MVADVLADVFLAMFIMVFFGGLALFYYLKTDTLNAKAVITYHKGVAQAKVIRQAAPIYAAFFAIWSIPLTVTAMTLFFDPRR